MIAPGTGLTEGGEADDDEFREVVGQSNGIKWAVAAGLPGLEDDIGVGGELEEELDTVCAVQIERQGSLAGCVVPPVEAAFGAGLVVEERSVAAADIAAGRLNS